MIECDVLVTGAAGFIGQYMCEHLLDAGVKVVGIDKNPAAVRFPLIQHDLTEPFPGRLKARSCVHLASSVGGILYNNAEKADMIAYNAAINSETIQLLRRAGCRSMVFFSSINVFESGPTFEHAPIRAQPQITTYAMSKAAGERALAEEFDQFLVIRPTNVYGRRQTRTHDRIGESHVIPDLIKKISENDVVEVLGDGTQRRNFVHVQDIVEFVARNLYLGGSRYFNLRSNATCTIAQLAQELATFLRRDVAFQFNPSFMKLETFKIEDFDIGPVKAFGWNPRYQNVASGLLV